MEMQMEFLRRLPTPEELKKEFRRADEDLERLLGEYNGYLNRVAEDDSGLMEK